MPNEVAKPQLLQRACAQKAIHTLAVESDRPRGLQQLRQLQQNRFEHNTANAAFAIATLAVGRTQRKCAIAPRTHARWSSSGCTCKFPISKEKEKKRRNKKVSVRGYRVLQRPAVYGKFSPTRHQSSLRDAQSFRGNIMTCIVAPRDPRSVD